MAVFDLPALAMACNTTQFNRNYGCLYCLDKGHHVSGTHVYPPSDEHQLRTPAQQRQWAEEAERGGLAVYGVRGTSILSKSIAIPSQCPIDYMHAVLEGVTKKLMQNYHLALLVCSMHTLLGKDISTDDIHKAEIMLQTFYTQAPKLYPLQLCSSMTHSLIHIPQFVRTCGLLWSYSMFGYENMNGHLKKLVHGTRNILDQLVFHTRWND